MPFQKEDAPKDLTKKFGVEISLWLRHVKGIAGLLPQHWLIDRERKAIFLRVGGWREYTRFELCVDKMVYVVKTNPSSKAYKEAEDSAFYDHPWYDIGVEIYSIDCPESSRQSDDYILSLLREGFEAYGASGNPEWVKSFSIRNLDATHVVRKTSTIEVP